MNDAESSFDGIVIHPIHPTTEDTLSVAYALADLDGADGEVTVRWTVERDGEIVTDLFNANLPAALTQRGDVIRAALSQLDARSSQHATVVIGNALPTAPQILVSGSLTPIEPLQCAVMAPSDDADDDPVTYAFSWTLNGLPFSHAVSESMLSTIPLEYLNVRQTWTCSVTPFDGADHGPSVSRDLSWTGFSIAHPIGSVDGRQLLTVGTGGVLAGKFDRATGFGEHSLPAPGVDAPASEQLFVATFTEDLTFSSVSATTGSGIVEANGMARLKNGMTAVAGVYRDGAATFGNTELPAQAHYWHAFISLVDDQGDYQEATSSTGAGFVVPYTATSLSDDGVVIAGAMNGTVDFGGHIAGPSAAHSSAFFAKYLSDTGWSWVLDASASGSSVAWSVRPVPGGGMIVVGEAEGTLTLGERSLSPEGAYAFVARISNDGDVAWLQDFPGPGSPEARGVVVQADGSSLVVGRVGGLATFGAFHKPTDRHAIFVAKLDPDGEVTHLATAPSLYAPYITGVAEAPDGGAFISGMFRGMMTLGEYPLAGNPLLENTAPQGQTPNHMPVYTGFIAHVDEHGDFTWARALESDARSYVMGVSAMADGSPLALVHYYGLTDLNGVLLDPDSSSTTALWRVNDFTERTF